MTAAIDTALSALHAQASARGLDVVIYVRADGRVDFNFEDLAGYVRHSVHADLEPGGALPLPAAALAASPIPERKVGAR